ncbi:MAG: glycosyltransferase [Firmicutes bacterium]|nr:glycosyltransferase [Bacillota bacterium]
MRILQVNAVYKTKSTGRIVMELHKKFKELGNESYVAYATENTSIVPDKNIFKIGNVLDHKLHAAAYRLDKMQGSHSRLATIFLLKRIKKISPDVVLTHNLHSNYLDVPYLLKKLKDMDIKVVLALHDCWHFTGGCYHYTDRGCSGWLSGCKDCKVLGRAAQKKYQINCETFDYVRPVIVATSKWIEREARKSLLGGRSDIHMIYNWIDTEVFYPRENENIRKKYKITGEKIILGVATNWSPDKGQNEMISIAREFPNASVVLVGSQAIKAEYPSNVIQIPFTDSKEELAELYSIADVFFNPSVQETFGLTSGEALACGTPIAVYNRTACPEFVEGNTGYIMQNKEDIKKAVSVIFEREELIGKTAISKECVEFVNKNFNLEQNVKKYLELFEEIIL